MLGKTQEFFFFLLFLFFWFNEAVGEREDAGGR